LPFSEDIEKDTLQLAFWLHYFLPIIRGIDIALASVLSWLCHINQERNSMAQATMFIAIWLNAEHNPAVAHSRMLPFFLHT
jgi:hypothetical protein